MITFKGPLLAGDAKGLDLKFPVIASPKLDGIRCTMVNGEAMSRALKPIQNDFVRRLLEARSDVLNWLDGELLVGDAFNGTQSGINSIKGMPEFTYHIFDRVQEGVPFHARFKSLESLELPSFCKLVPHIPIHSQERLDAYYEEMLLLGLEGIMIRDPYGRYKCGRSTQKEGILLKLKPFEDSEARIIGFEELMHNENEAEINALGLSQRSSCKDGKVPGNTLGKFLVVGTEDEHYNGVEFAIGTGKGLTHVLRQEIWDNREAYLGKLIKFKYQKVGSIDKPRIPIYLGFRDKADLTPK